MIQVEIYEDTTLNGDGDGDEDDKGELKLVVVQFYLS